MSTFWGELPFRELGHLFRELSRPQEAIIAYKNYLELEPDVIEAPIIRKVMQKLKGE